ncbi:NO-inducible flavohemoprotein [Paenibacillus popilliae]|nr:NO-inducible flavohemoprotein [Paenibacillus popilliae]
MLKPRTIEIVKATVPVLEAHGQQITKRFYELMFSNHPELLNIFNHANQRQGRQSQALARAIYAAAANIDRLEDIMPVVKQIAHKHRALHIQPEHYPIVGKNLLLAIKDVLGDAATDDILEAWVKAYFVIADMFIQVERDMYQAAAEAEGGWEGFRSFRVIRKVRESDVVTSFYLHPEDGGAISAFHPGQYITVRVKPEGSANTHLRHYSLSQDSGRDTYRISVKRESGDAHSPAGIVSCYLHDVVQEGDRLEVTAPAGDFTLKEGSDAPIVLLSGGVGLTPIMSMLQALAKQEPDRDIYFIHSARNHRMHAFRDEVRALTEANGRIRSFVFYDRPEEGDACDRQGFIDEAWLAATLPADVWQQADAYFCGPVPFMKAVYRALTRLGVATDRIHYEFFGPAGALEEA